MTPRLSPKAREVLTMLASSPGAVAEELVLIAYGFKREMLARLVLAGLVTVVTDTLRVDEGTIRIDLVTITDAGRKALEEDQRLRDD
jgi:DNA-binding MarR family transcriptional regulator